MLKRASSYHQAITGSGIILIAATQWIIFYLLNNIKGIIDQIAFNFSIATSFMASDPLTLDSSCTGKINSDELHQTPS